MTDCIVKTHRLHSDNLDLLNSSIVQPTYDRKKIGYGIVHLGLGAFSRCHLAYYTQESLNAKPDNWAIVGVSMRSAGVKESLKPQDYLYTIAENYNDQSKYQLIASVVDVLVAPAAPSTVVDYIASSACKIVSLTVTEKAYCLNSASGELDFAHQDIKHDLLNLSRPKSAIGFVVAGLQQRFEKSHGGITLLSCDNLSDNGKKLQKAVLSFASSINPPLASWISERCTFPCTMVDRIVPASTTEFQQRASKDLGLVDKAALATETFSQWVIEDKFAAGRPDWQCAGAQFVEDVAPYEMMKLRLLNASHSTIAYMGALASFETVSDAMAIEAINKTVRHLMANEMRPSIEGLDSFDFAAYEKQLIERFANKSLRHRTQQIAIDGSQKIPQRLFGALLFHAEKQHKFDAICICIAAWIKYTLGETEAGTTYLVDDPYNDIFVSLKAQHQSNSMAYLRGVLTIDSIFPISISQNPSVCLAIENWFTRIQTQGVHLTLLQFLESRK